MKYPPLLPYIEKYMIKANPSPKGNGSAFNLSGDPIGTRTRVTAVKGRCLRPLDHGADLLYGQMFRSALLLTAMRFFCFGSDGWIRTADLPGMNRPL